MSVRGVVTSVSCFLVLGAAGLMGHAAVESVPVGHAQPPHVFARPSTDDVTHRVVGQEPPPRQASDQGAAAAPRKVRPWWGWLLLGRLHPLVVHFPIGLLTAAAAIEALHVLRRRPVPSEAGTYCLAFGVAGAVVSAWFGTLNADHQTVTGEAAITLERHQVMGWIAVAAATAALAAGQLARRASQFRMIAVYLGLVVGTSAVVGATGHLGGELVYGAEYFTGVLPWNQEARAAAAARASARPAVTHPPVTGAPASPAPASPSRPSAASPASRDVTPSSSVPRPGPGTATTDQSSAGTGTVTKADPAPVPMAAHTDGAAFELTEQAAAGVDFTRDVMPILEKTCVECHGPDKVKARLRMDSVAGLQKGGKSGPLLKPGDPENSLILRRVLGLDGDDQMPLDKDPLTETQIDTLRRWIAAGASFGAAGSQ